MTSEADARDTRIEPLAPSSPARVMNALYDRIGCSYIATRGEVVPIPHDCRDGFLMAYWRRPEAYLDATVRANISVFSLLPADEVEAMVAGLRADLATGEWDRRHGDLLGHDELDLGYRLLIAE
jgi:hypothetical protein